MKWVNFLHIYQPPTQSKGVIDQVMRESYELIIALLKRYPKVRLTVNINGSLIELLLRDGHAGFISELASFVREGRVELVGSAMYHPILPLISADLARRQIMRNEEILRTHFGSDLKLRGFYFPEMAYSPAAGKIVKDMGYEWIILDELHAETDRPGMIDPRTRYVDADNGLGVVFRNNEYSKTFPPEYIVTKLAAARAKGGDENAIGEYLVTAHDGELYGHWHTDDKGFYEKAFTSPDIHMITVSEYLDGLSAAKSETKKIGLKTASWESLPTELEEGTSFWLWSAPGNVIQDRLWHFANACALVVSQHSADPHAGEAETLLDKGFASCAWWWASGRKIGPFSPVSWNPSEIEEGAAMLLDSVRVLSSVPADERTKIEEAFVALKDMVWKEHWSRYSPQ